ncbi:hypothetical protein [Pontibacter sp. G13]|uniref:hypothetical protein n=1 Tax=Pontibacter sp. G13 TaxID=3074898 RepID=UPI0028892106|nr:hypothetical protein [Pontibacter sp. G13]WNJ20136.1 hypothetical protein RJD25_06600 [Pontibacter sp. G13]
MNLNRIGLLLLMLIGMGSALQAQRNSRSFLVEGGYHLAFLNPGSFNYLVDELYNPRLAVDGTELSPVSNVHGVYAAIGVRRRKNDKRLTFRSYETQLNATELDENGERLRREAMLSGYSLGLSMTGYLLPIGDYSYVGVGGGLILSNTQMSTGTASLSSQAGDIQLERIVNEFDLGFEISVPFHAGFGRVFGVTWEPYYLLSFSGTDAEPFANELIGEDINNTDPLKSEWDHFGMRVSVSVDLGR